MGKGSNDAAPSSQTVVQSNLPEYARPYFERLMNRTEANSNQPYQLYGGPRIADFSSLQNQAFARAGDLAGGQDFASQFASGANMAGVAGLLGTPGYQAGQFSGGHSPTNFSVDRVGANQGFQGVSPQAQGRPDVFNDDVAGRYMSPYISRVLDAQKNRAARNANEQAVIRRGEQAATGALGGTRGEVQNALAERDLNDRLTEIDARGLESAFGQAQGQFERDRAALTGADRFNIENLMRGDLANQQAGLSAQGQRLQAETTNQRSLLDALQSSESANQFASRFGLDAFGQNESMRQRQAQDFLSRMQGVGGLSGQLGSLLSGNQQRDIAAINAQRDLGQQQQQRDQASLDLAYSDFVNQRDYDRNQLNFLSSILRGVPVTSSSTTSAFENPNPYSQMLGLGVNALALNRALGGGG